MKKQIVKHGAGLKVGEIVEIVGTVQPKRAKTRIIVEDSAGDRHAIAPDYLAEVAAHAVLFDVEPERETLVLISQTYGTNAIKPTHTQRKLF
jgi:hypothetical protein